MPHFYELADSSIVFRQHYLQDGKPTIRDFLLQRDGTLSRVLWKGEPSIKAIKVLDSIKVNRGQLFTVFEGLSSELTKRPPQMQAPLSKDNYIEAYLFLNENAAYQDDCEGRALPIYSSYGRNMFIRGLDVTEFLLHPEGRENEPAFGAGFLEAFFDIRIPDGFEAIALSEIHAAILASEDKNMFEEGEEFIKWLIHGEGLPAMSKDLWEHMRDNAETFRDHILELSEVTTMEVAMIRGCKFLRKFGETDTLYPYLHRLIEREKSGLACLWLARYALEDKYPSEALKYASQGASLRNGPCCYLAAKICTSRGLNDLSRMYLDMGVNAGDGDCFYLMAHEIMAFAQKGEDNPFHCKHPERTAMSYADEGVCLRSSKAMVFMARLLQDFLGDEGTALALQLLLRAEEVGEKEALYWLARYYVVDHVGGESKDLFLAEHYIKKAIVEDAYLYEECQLLYAEILLAQGNPPQAYLFIEELARKGFEKAQVALGKILAGAIPEYPDDADPIALPFLEKLKQPKAFYKAILWREYPEIITAKEAASKLGKLAKEGEALAFRELARIYREGPREIRDEKKAAHFEECFRKYGSK